MKKKYNPSTTSKTTHVGFRCPNEIHKQLIAASKGNKTKWLNDAVKEKLDRDKTSNIDSRKK